MAKYRFPKSLAVCADRYYRLRNERLAQQKIVDKIASEEKAIKNHLIDSIPKSQASGISGKLARVTVVKREDPIVKDEEVFRKYINRSKRFDLAYKLRPSSVACRDMWDEGKDIPGVERFVIVTLSLNKV